MICQLDSTVGQGWYSDPFRASSGTDCCAQLVLLAFAVLQPKSPGKNVGNDFIAGANDKSNAILARQVTTLGDTSPIAVALCRAAALTFVTNSSIYRVYIP